MIEYISAFIVVFAFAGAGPLCMALMMKDDFKPKPHIKKHYWQEVEHEGGSITIESSYH